MTQLANMYAGALYDLAAEDQAVDSVLDQLRVLNTSFSDEPGFLKLLCEHSISKEERIGILDSSFRGKVHPYLLNFLKLLTEKGYIRHFADCVSAYQAKYDEVHGILPVKVVSAIPLTQAQQEKLCAKLQTVTEKKIRLSAYVDPSVIGGIRLDYDGKRVDGTVQKRLDSVKAMLKGTLL